MSPKSPQAMSATSSTEGPPDLSAGLHHEVEVGNASGQREKQLPVEELLEAAPVFASGNSELQQRLLRTFAALSLSKCGAEPARPAAVAAAPSPLSALAESAAAAPTAYIPAASASIRRPAANWEQAVAAAKDGTTRHARGSGESAAGETVFQGRIPTPESAAATSVTSAAVTTGRSRRQITSFEAAAAATLPEHSPPPATSAAAHARGSLQEPFSRGASMARAESPGTWSEATDSTGCTESPDIVRPPAFGSWYHYSLADVPEEAMSVRGMQRACHLMLMRCRQVAAVAAAENSSSSSTPAAGATAAEEGAEDPRVSVGPRRRG